MTWNLRRNVVFRCCAVAAWRECSSLSYDTFSLDSSESRLRKRLSRDIDKKPTKESRICGERELPFLYLIIMNNTVTISVPDRETSSKHSRLHKVRNSDEIEL